jgi:hypothetical protein
MIWFWLAFFVAVLSWLLAGPWLLRQLFVWRVRRMGRVGR